MIGCLDVKYCFRLLKEMAAETRSTERSHNAQALILLDDRKTLLLGLSPS